LGYRNFPAVTLRRSLHAGGRNHYIRVFRLGANRATRFRES
jgi:hypothetical protein